MPHLHSNLLQIPIETLLKSPREHYLANLSYPSSSIEESINRLSRLQSMGLTHLACEKVGERFSPALIGKGVRGVVFQGLMGGEVVAVKLLRTDSAVASMEREAQIHSLANSLGIGPLLIKHSEEAIVMEYVEGVRLGEYIASKPQGLPLVVEDVLRQCYVMDVNGLDHGQLTDSSDHVIVQENNRPRIIDFSHASTTRKTSNLTSFVSYLMNTVLEKHREDHEIHQSLRLYKEKKTAQSYEQVRDKLLNLLG
jgi:putative serine/threonine protein kinase